MTVRTGLGVDSHRFAAGRRLVIGGVEVPHDRPVLRIDPFEVIESLGERGPVAEQLGQYEDRRSQRDMSAYVADSNNDGGNNQDENNQNDESGDQGDVNN